MQWFEILEMTGMAATLWIVFLIVKELRQIIKESNKGRVSDKCDLD